MELQCSRLHSSSLVLYSKKNGINTNINNRGQPLIPSDQDQVSVCIGTKNVITNDHSLKKEGHARITMLPIALLIITLKILSFFKFKSELG